MARLEPIGQDIWVAEGPKIRFMGLLLSTRSTIVRLRDGALWVHSPIQYDAAFCEEIARLGPIQYLLAPNLYHHLFLKEWQQECPGAQVIGPAGLPAKRPDINFSWLLDDSQNDPWSEEINRVVFTGSRAFDEHVFFHRASGTAILTDLIVNVPMDDQSFLGRLIARAEGVAYPNGRTPLLYRLGMRDRAKGAEAVRAMLDWQPRQAIISHGAWFRENATAELRARFGWLPV